MTGLRSNQLAVNVYVNNLICAVIVYRQEEGFIRIDAESFHIGIYKAGVLHTQANLTVGLHPHTAARPVIVHTGLLVQVHPAFRAGSCVQLKPSVNRVVAAHSLAFHTDLGGLAFIAVNDLPLGFGVGAVGHADGVTGNRDGFAGIYRFFRFFRLFRCRGDGAGEVGDFQSGQYSVINRYIVIVSAGSAPEGCADTYIQILAGQNQIDYFHAGDRAGTSRVKGHSIGSDGVLESTVHISVDCAVVLHGNSHLVPGAVHTQNRIGISVEVTVNRLIHIKALIVAQSAVGNHTEETILIGRAVGKPPMAFKLIGVGAIGSEEHIHGDGDAIHAFSLVQRVFQPHIALGEVSVVASHIENIALHFVFISGNVAYDFQSVHTVFKVPAAGSGRGGIGVDGSHRLCIRSAGVEPHIVIICGGRTPRKDFRTTGTNQQGVELIEAVNHGGFANGVLGLAVYIKSQIAIFGNGGDHFMPLSIYRDSSVITSGVIGITVSIVVVEATGSAKAGPRTSGVLNECPKALVIVAFVYTNLHGNGHGRSRIPGIGVCNCQHIVIVTGRTDRHIGVVVFFLKSHSPFRRLIQSSCLAAYRIGIAAFKAILGQQLHFIQTHGTHRLASPKGEGGSYQGGGGHAGC